MAERRMFAKSVIDSDAFLEMQPITQMLYFHLAMTADDEGFLNNSKRIMRMVGATEKDLKLLLEKQFLLGFESGVVVIKHWRVHNYIPNDMFKKTLFSEERAQLSVDGNGLYTTCIQNVYSLDTQDRIGKDRIGKEKDISKEISKKKADKSADTHTNERIFQKPTLEDVQAYCSERQNYVDPQQWYDFYEAKGWMVGKNHMKDWKAAVRTWEHGSAQSKAEEDVRQIRLEREKLKYAAWGIEAGKHVEAF